MKKIFCTFLCCVLIMSMVSCGYPDESKKAPDNWPTYAVGDMTFPNEAGWTAADISGFSDASAEPFQLFGISDQVQWVGCIASPEWTAKTRNFLSISYLKMTGKVTDETLEGLLEGYKDLKAAFLSVNMTVSVLSSPQIVRYGDHTALTFTCRFTMEDGTRMIVYTGLMGHGERLYQFHYVDYQSGEETDVLAQILSGLKWIE